MKKLKNFAAILCLICMFSAVFVGCGNSGNAPYVIDNSKDLVVYERDSQSESGEPLYTSKKLTFVTEINGSFKVNRPFSFDKDDENKRVYDNIYLYEKDFFWMDVQGSLNLKDMFYELSDSTDEQYVKVNEEAGRLEIQKAGIYKIVFNITTFKFDLEFKSEITEPVYERIENCDFYTTKTGWVEATVNTDNIDEFCVKNFIVETGALLSVQSHFVHTSNFKVKSDENCKDRYLNDVAGSVFFLIGGKYDIYVNAETYVVRAELLDKATADYTCTVFKDGNFAAIDKKDASVPCEFIYRCTVEKDGSLVPDMFYNANGYPYKLTVNDSDLVSGNKYKFFKKAGTYDLTINLDTFTIDVAAAGD